MIIALREDLTLPDEKAGHDTNWTYISIYDENNKLLSRSNRNHSEGFISHEYDGLIYISPYRNAEVSITVDSINKKFGKTNNDCSKG